MERKQIFVYGSLKRGGFLNASLAIRGGEYVSDAELDGHTLYSVGGMFPAMLPAEGKHVRGEVWSVPRHEVEGWLDGVEGAYDRKDVRLRDGRKVEAYVWALCGSLGFRADEHWGEEWPVDQHRYRGGW